MRKTVCTLVATLIAGMTLPAIAELQDVKVGGSLRIRGNWYSEDNLTFDKDAGNDVLFVEQRTTVNVSASFTENVGAYIELDHYGNWGDSFRGLDSDGLLTGTDGLSNSFSEYNQDGRGFPTISNDGSVSLYQGYIEVKEIWDSPLSVRIGRQEITLPSEFLIGNNNTSSNFRGLSFDGITTSSQFGDFKLQSWVAELLRNNNPNRIESSGDTWFNGLYGSYVGFEDMTIDAYLMRYYQAKTDVTEAQGYVDSIAFFTFGMRFAGSKAQFDWDVEGAYQMGDSGLPDVANVSSEDVQAFGLTAKAGYTFDVKMQPRVFVNGAYFSGDEEDSAFNRMFSDFEYSEFIDSTDLSNVWTVGGGASAQVTESIGITGVANYFQVVEDFGASDDDLGIEVALYASYQYSEDLGFNVGYAHFFSGDGVEDGQFVASNGNAFIGGFGEADDLDYAFIETSIKF
jgi:hypothetical protein